MIPEAKLNSSPEIGLGKIVEHDPATHVISKVAGENIGFGRALNFVAGTNQVKLPGGASGSFAGVSGHSFEASDFDNEKYLAKDPVAVVRRGIVMVAVDEVVTEGSAVRFSRTTDAGVFRMTATAGRTVLLKNARWAGSATNGMAPLMIDGAIETVDE